MSEQLTFNTTASKHATLMMELDIARQCGYSSVEIIYQKVRDYLAAGHSETELQQALKGFEVKGIGALLNIERQGRDKKQMLIEAENLIAMAKLVDAKGIQIVTGPLDFKVVKAYRSGSPSADYQGLIALDTDAQLRETAVNLQLLSDMAKDHDVILYLEALAWTPINTLELQQRLMHLTDRDNVKLVVDFWHCYASGDNPDSLAKLPSELIYGVHVCDSLPFTGGVPDESVLRNVATGDGVLNLREWIGAVKSTGYDGWWCSETFCKKQQQDNSYAVSKMLKNQLIDLLS